MIIMRLTNEQIEKKSVSRVIFGKWRPIRYFVKECSDCGYWIRAWKLQPCGSCRVRRWFDKVQRERSMLY